MLSSVRFSSRVFVCVKTVCSFIITQNSCKQLSYSKSILSSIVVSKKGICGNLKRYDCSNIVQKVVYITTSDIWHAIKIDTSTLFV